MRRLSLCLTATALVVGASGVHAGDAAYRGRGDWGRDVGVVTAESRYGPQTISGPVRRAGHRLEVRLPGGTWIDCHLSCADALRRETIDFWQNHNGNRNGGSGDGPGYFLWRR